jgi:hypothetical protein
VVQYVAPSDDPNDFTDQLIIRIRGDNVDPVLGGSGTGGDDLIIVSSTSQMVPVRVEGGPGDDTVIVGGGPEGLNNILSFFNPNANQGLGLGPLVLVGGYFDVATSEYINHDHDTVIIDDSQDSGENFGNINAFIEQRLGLPDPIEVGIVSGLGMQLSRMHDNGTPDDITDDYLYETDGRVEFEGFEVVDVRLGTGADTMTIGGDYDLDKSSGTAGQPSAELKVSSEIPTEPAG